MQWNKRGESLFAYLGSLASHPARFEGRSCLLFMDLAARVNNANSGAVPFATVYIYLGSP